LQNRCVAKPDVLSRRKTKCFNRALRFHHAPSIELQRLARILIAQIGIDLRSPYFAIVLIGDCAYRRLRMLGLFARWGHNVLITTMAVLTIAMVVSLIR
jgi:hypothetical protein